MLFFRPIPKIRVVYKSGYVHDFEVLEFSATSNSFKWTAFDSTKAPLKLGFDDIAAVWQVGVRRKFDITYVGWVARAK